MGSSCLSVSDHRFCIIGLCNYAQVGVDPLGCLIQGFTSAEKKRSSLDNMTRDSQNRKIKLKLEKETKILETDSGILEWDEEKVLAIKNLETRA